MSWKPDLPEGDETAKIHDRIAPFVSGHGVDLGCGCWKLKVERSPSNSCLGVDAGLCTMSANEADIIHDCISLPMFADESFDYVYSSHTLEDMKNPEAALAEWFRLCRPGGRVILYLPLARQRAKELGIKNWESFYPDKGTKGANVYHENDFTPQQIKDLVAKISDTELLADEIRGDKDEYSFLLVFRKVCRLPHPVRLPSAKRALVVRYGAIGDYIQTTPVLSKLKQEGYHVTLNCSEIGPTVLAHNPNVDEFAVQIRDYVPNQGTVSGPLWEYWNDLSKRYDKFINLTGAAEESLLLPDTRLMHIMDDLRGKHPELNERSVHYNAVRWVQKQVGDQNYYDNHLKRAGYSDTGRNGELYFSQSEELAAQGFRDRYPGRFIVMWVLSGSSYHKRYPYFQQVAQELIVKNPDILLISVGDPECQLIERSESNKYLPRSGKWILRSSLVMTKYADLVIGPETGILNAAGCFPTPKITFLSHSSHENLCKYWENDYCVSPENVECHPCHVLHYTHAVNQECPTCKGSTHTWKGHGEVSGGMWTCPYEIPEDLKDNKGLGVPTPICTSRLQPKRVMSRIDEVYKRWKSCPKP